VVINYESVFGIYAGGHRFLKFELGRCLHFLQAEGKNSGKPVFTKKMNGKDTLAKYTVDADGSKDNGFFDDDLPANVFPKYVFWQDGGKFGYSISTSSDLSRQEKIGILKAAIKK
jgi:bla regulator protein blaR1